MAPKSKGNPSSELGGVLEPRDDPIWQDIAPINNFNDFILFNPPGKFERQMVETVGHTYAKVPIIFRTFVAAIVSRVVMPRFIDFNEWRLHVSAHLYRICGHRRSEKSDMKSIRRDCVLMESRINARLDSIMRRMKALEAASEEMLIKMHGITADVKDIVHREVVTIKQTQKKESKSAANVNEGSQDDECVCWPDTDPSDNEIDPMEHRYQKTDLKEEMNSFSKEDLDTPHRDALNRKLDEVFKNKELSSASSNNAKQRGRSRSNSRSDEERIAEAQISGWVRRSLSPASDLEQITNGVAFATYAASNRTHSLPQHVNSLVRDEFPPI